MPQYEFYRDSMCQLHLRRLALIIPYLSFGTATGFALQHAPRESSDYVTVVSNSRQAS